MQDCPKGAAEQSPGLAAFFAANPGYRRHLSIYPERGCVRTQPFQGGIFPSVDRKKARPTLGVVTQSRWDRSFETVSKLPHSIANFAKRLCVYLR
jgi:hypothetical protein